MTDVTSLLDEKISELEQQVAALRSARAALNGQPRTAPASRQLGRREFTAAQRAEISRRMKATWAKRKQLLTKPSTSAATAGKKAAAGGTIKRRLSPEGRARIAEAARRRWAARRKEQSA